MLVNSLFSAALALVGAVSACPGIDHAQGLAPRKVDHSIQPGGGDSLLRDLTWGDLVVLATTDVHGWYMGKHSFGPLMRSFFVFAMLTM